jgi:hypothetical protein
MSQGLEITEFKSLKGQEAFSSLKTFQTVFGAYPAYYLMGTEFVSLG